MPGRHHHPVTVRFGDCDPAGIAYYPRFYDWFHQAMETWFEAALGQTYAQILKTHLFPAVRSEAQFDAPCRLGERLDIEVTVLRLGGASLTLGYRVIDTEGTVRATGSTIVVVVAGEAGRAPTIKSTRLPDAMRTRIDQFMVRNDADSAVYSPGSSGGRRR